MVFRLLEGRSFSFLVFLKIFTPPPTHPLEIVNKKHSDKSKRVALFWVK